MTFELAEQLYKDTREKEETVTLNGDSSLWPAPIDKAAFPGLPGEIIRAVEPHTESDPIAILIQTLTAFGNVIGPGPHWKVEADRHPMRLFAVIVGETAKARKGTSEGIVKKLFEDVESEWIRDRSKTGLSSGEGLIWQVRDPGEKDDPGVADKRLWIQEPEFGTVLRILGREGNTLSGVMRQAWDSGHLSTLTKHSPAKATGAHISITGHITQDELRTYLSRTETYNGLANRFIWLCVKRSKILPEGGRLHEMDLTPLTDKIRAAVQFAKSVDEVRRDHEANEIWKAVYEELSEGKPGMIGAVLSRSDTQVMRLASIYALMDCSKLILKEHLLAGLALWDFAENSVQYIFRGKTGNDDADTIFEALMKSEGDLTRTDINNLFGRNKSKAEIDEAVCLLHKLKRVQVIRKTTGGRPSERITRGNEINEINEKRLLS